ncbi:MAG TPA: HAD family hydrolase [Candidatus Limnocylindria bacterium]|jgi:2-haloacid dehalogenase|nr:HAD family hydrolase [Candidatus Limnocylindria bacterium]
MTVDWVTFDCYGTLIDWERGITDALLPLLPPGIDRKALAEWYIGMEAEFEAEGYHLYRHVLDRVGRRVLKSLDVPISEEDPSPLPSSLAEWRPFGEVPAALGALRDRGRKLAILSNVDRDLLESSIVRLGIRPDLAVTAEDSGSYKPVSGHWRHFLQRSGATAARTVHVGASQYHDIRPASALGFRTVFVDRHGEALETAPTRVIRDLSTLPEVIDELE